MRTLLATTFVTLDGVMQAPGGPEEDPSDDFKWGGWSFAYFDEAVGEVMEETMGVPFDLVLGRKTYDIFAGFWPTAPDDMGGKVLNDATKYVASRGTPDLSWEKSVLLEGDVVEAVKQLKAGDGPQLQVHGSSDFLQTLIRANLVDVYQLVISPVVIGQGKRLFGDGTIPAALKLISSRTSPSGVVTVRYEPAGDIPLGSFG